METGPHPLAWLIRRLVRFPAAVGSTPVEVTMICEGERERWIRQFGQTRFESVLRIAKADQATECHERFGAFEFGIRLLADEQGLSMPVRHARFLGILPPRWLTPLRLTRETVDEQGRAAFDVDLRLPGLGRLIRYRDSLRVRTDHD